MQGSRYISGAVMMLLLAACAGPTRVALTPEVRQQLTDVSAKSVVWQDEVVAPVALPGASAAVGGLIGAMIDSSIAEGRQNTVQGMINPFYASVDDYDFRKDFWSALGTSFQGDYSLKLNGFSNSTLRHTKNPATDLPKGKSVLFVNTEYVFTPDFSRINVITWASVWQSGIDKPVYANQFVYQSAAVGSGNAESIQLWSANKGQQYRTVMAESIAETVAMLKLDLASSETDTVQAKSVVLKKVDGPVTYNISGPVLAERNGRIMARHTDGHIYSLTN